MTEWFGAKWASFLMGFCKVEFVCYNWEPNWLGMVIIWTAGWCLVAVLFAIILNTLILNTRKVIS